jgi:glycosyltransferase involved in cell wall biosynthesis
MKITWLYFGDHSKHPFIRIGVRSLAGRGHDVGVWDVSPQRARNGYRHRAVAADLNARGGGSAASRLAYLRLLITAPTHLLVERPDAVIVTMPHMIPVAMMARQLLGSRVVYYPFEVLGEQAGRVNRLWLVLERFFISRVVDALITQNEERAAIYRSERGARVEPAIVHNYKPRAPGVRAPGRLRALLGLRENERIVLYEGLLVHGRWLDKLIRSARYLAEGTTLVLMGEPTPWWEAEGKHLAEDPALGRRVKIAPFVPHEELPGYVVDADAGVIIYDRSCRNNYFCEPGKLGDYVRAGIPVIAPDFPTIGPVIRRYRIGVTFSDADPAKIARAIETAVAAPESAWAAGLESASRELVWETQEHAFLNAVTGC